MNVLKKLTNIKAIIFDFDGVIVDSIEAKTNAFEQLYNRYGDDVKQKVKDYHLRNGGVSRFEKLKYYHKNFLGVDLNEHELKDLASSFSKIVLEKVINASFVEGVSAYIQNKSKNLDLFISTGTPQKEIELILKARNIDVFFKDVFGSPDKKIDHIKKILEMQDLQSNEIIFFGDSLSDLEAAKYYDINFILVKNRYNTFLQENHLGDSIENFLELNRF